MEGGKGCVRRSMREILQGHAHFQVYHSTYCSLVCIEVYFLFMLWGGGGGGGDPRSPPPPSL